MKKLFYTLSVIAALIAVPGCGDALYDVYNGLTGPVECVGVKADISIVVGTTENLHASVYPSMTHNKNVSWSSSDSSIVAVDQNGVITGIAVGSATVTVTTEDGGFTDVCAVNVAPAPVPIQNLGFLYTARTVGRDLTINLYDILVIDPAGATNTEMTWSSSNNIIATVDENGIVTGHSYGTAIITATSNTWGKTAECTVTVAQPADLTYVVLYNKNAADAAGTVPFDGVQYKTGESVTAAAGAALSRPGYAFSHWNTKADNTGIIVNPGVSYPIGSSDITFFAQWNSTNADLSGITLSNGGILTTIFDPSKTEYNARVFNDYHSVTVTGIKADINATISDPVTLNNLEVGVRQQAVITVWAESGAVKTYYVYVDRIGGYISAAPELADCKIQLDYISHGSFQRDANPANISTITSGFRMGLTEITRQQFNAIMGSDPSDPFDPPTDTEHPVQNINWYHAIAFCNKLSMAEGLTPAYTVSGVNFLTLTFGDIPTTSDPDWNSAVCDWSANGYRLPTEMEWMWAAMGSYRGSGNPRPVYLTGYGKKFAGSDSVLADGSGGTRVIGNYSVFGYGSGETGATTTNRTNPVASKSPNEINLYDMSGNVFEWCWDWKSPATTRVIMGGSFSHVASDSAIAVVNHIGPYEQKNCVGFRVVRN